MRQDMQLAVFLENRPGTLAKMCQALAQEGINLLALTVSDNVDHAVVRLVVDKPQEALHLLGSSG
ncbi:MAG: ACT domain-containing protein, partial [Planctomycetota bacterium]